jgi:acetyl esterase/lipase
MTKITPVPFDPELAATLAGFPVDPDASPLSRESLPAHRADMNARARTVAEVIGRRPVEFEDRLIPGPAGAPDLEVTLLRPAGSGPHQPLPALYNIHGGGMIMGSRSMDTGRLVDLVVSLGIVAMSVEYRLAPEHPDPAPVEDCYAGLVWLASNAAELGVDPERIVVMGGSAGGGLSAGVALLARDRKGPSIAGQLLLCPMVDDTNTTVSSHQYAGIGTWTREMNLVAWNALLGETAGAETADRETAGAEIAGRETADAETAGRETADAETADAETGDGEAAAGRTTDGKHISPYAAPARAEDLSGLPPAFIEAGSAELFRDEDVAYASRIWAAGGQAELHVWSGGFHGFDVFAPDSALTADALATRESWFRRILGLTS